ncbi:MAG: putative DNA binding domain-containing protein [Bacillota bacterium]|nr:putative DNA binding domain-containing protein [Bacillota bacterium]
MDRLLLQGESKLIEYKQEYSKTLLKTVSAFANYHDGVIIVGLSDTGEVLGVTYPEEISLSLENAINASIEPTPFYEITRENVDGKAIIVLKVYKGDYTPYIWNNRAYKRMDTATVPVDRYAHEELKLQGRNMSFEELICGDQSLEFDTLSRKMKQSLKIHDFSEDLLITLGLKATGKYNNAAALLSDANPLAHAAIQLVAYAGSSVLEIKDRQSVERVSILRQFDMAMDFYKKHINVRELIEGPYRQTMEEVPLVAYREAVANAIVHRDYLRQSHIRIEFFTDRVDITSPGGLPIGISEEEYYEGRLSVPRNRIVAEVFLRLKIIERLATGIRRIKEYYRDYDVKPGFNVYENSIMVTLPMIGPRGHSSESAVLETPDHLTGKELLIFKVISERGAMSRVELEQELGLRKSQTSEIIAGLRSRGLVAQIGRGKDTKYVIRQ